MAGNWVPQARGYMCPESMKSLIALETNVLRKDPSYKRNFFQGGFASKINTVPGIGYLEAVGKTLKQNGKIPH